MMNLKVAALSLAMVCGTSLAQTAPSAHLGTLNDVEGQASIEGRMLSPRSAGSVNLEAGHVIATANGKAEILLTPGVFLRVGNESTLEMVTPELLHTEVRLQRGRAEVEVDSISPTNRILVDLPHGQTQLMERGLYSFDAESGVVRVFDGKAAVYPGEDVKTDVKPIEVKGGHELTVAALGAKPQRFDRNQAMDDLYRWGSLRAKYLDDANQNVSREYPGGNAYPGWYWAGGPYGYTWWPGDGYLWSPYGYGFYSPYAFYGGGFYGGGFYGGGFGRGFGGGGFRGGRR